MPPFQEIAIWCEIQSGILVKNAVVLIDEINAQLGSGQTGYQAIVDSRVSLR